jgi:hypothetical protein
MPSISALDKSLSFQPRYNSYLYESLPCREAFADGYRAVQFTVKGPAGGNFTLEMQARESCTAPAYKSSWFLVEGLTGSKQTITVSFHSFSGLNQDAITGFVFSTWSNSSTPWEISQIQLLCASISPPLHATAISKRDK